MENFLNLIKNIFNKISRIGWFIWLAVGVAILGFVLFASPTTENKLIGQLHQQAESLRSLADGTSTSQPFISSPTNTMQLSSPAFEPNAAIPSQYTCDGKGMSPPLQISDVPLNAKSLVLIVYDPDAPIAGGFTHWVVLNIPTQTTMIAENTVPAGAIQGQNSSGKNEWDAPCPPSGTHHYQFMLYALDVELNIPVSGSLQDLQKSMEGHLVDQNTLVGTYAKK